MKIVAALVLVLSSGAFVFSVSAHRSARAPTPAGGAVPASVEATRGPTDRAVANEVALLCERIHALEAEVQHLSRRPEAVAGDDGEAGLDYAPAIESLWRAVEDLRATTRFEDPETRRRLAEAVREVEGRSQRDRRESRRARQQERTEARLDALAADARLTSRQRESLLALSVSEREQRREIFGAVRSGEMSPAEIREAFMELSTETEAEARRILDDRQFEQYMAVREQERTEMRRAMMGGRGRGGRMGGGGWDEAAGP
jgi:hypothetical protein